MPTRPKFLLGCFVCAHAVLAQNANCDLHNYKPQEGLKAVANDGVLELAWDGRKGEQLRASFTIREGHPTVSELAARKSGKWIILGRNLTPEYQVTTGHRRLSEQQMAPLRKLGVQFTPEVVDREKWNAFWDAPLMVPGLPNSSWDLPRNRKRFAVRGRRITRRVVR